MMDYIEVSGKNKDEAIIKASVQLETPSDELDIQIISEGSSGFLGFGAKPAIIRVRKKDPSELEAEAEVKKIAKQMEKNTSEEKVQAEKKPVEKKVQTASENVPAAEEKKEQPKKEVPQKDFVKKESEHKNKKEFQKKDKKPGRQKKAVQEKVSEEKAVQEKPVRRESRPIELITDPAEIADIENKASVFLTDVFKAMNLGVEISVKYNTEEKSLDVEFSGDDMGILIGKRGQTLDSLQYLTSLVVNKGKNNYVRVKLDTEDYRSRRKETLENLAKGIAYKVRRTRKPVILEPMNPYERRIIHSALQSNRYVETFSEGEEPYRHIVVKLKSRRG